MKVSVREEENIKRLEVVVLCQKRTPFVDELAHKIGRISVFIAGRDGGKTVRLPIDEVFYFEAVEDRTYIYCAEKLYGCELKLYELESRLAGAAFQRISKSCILNLDRIRTARGMINGRLLLELENGEKLVVNRSYVQNLKENIKRL